ncbi:PIN domain-containing protein [Allosaccharopolyspora coralli]|uniref:Ribonuclease VapC n=1 Tax=Allosaccharopolyspora coralli TaxID=2665642 RepID=A0A5Q3Q9Z0_9PSEU|nr:type II toxin-antitoxin system VapC family toxin [Allosaccharopolyspora coralli]QGK71302.1 PIN domain-containing protein [Allosaccharopolyspora coralli]
MIVLDADVIIAHFDASNVHHERAETLLTREIGEDFGANPLTLAEVLVVPARDNRLETVRTALRELEVQELPFPDDTAVKLAELRAATGLKMPDCCVLLTAEHCAARVASFDDRVIQAAITRNVEALSQ